MLKNHKDPDLKKQSRLLWVPLWILCLVGGATFFYFVGKELGRQQSFEAIWNSDSKGQQLALGGLLQGRPPSTNLAALPLIQTEQAFIAEVGKDTPEGAAALSRLAGFYALQGDYRAAQDSYEELLAILQQHLGADHPDVAVIQDNIRTLNQLDASPASGVKAVETNVPPVMRAP